MPHKQFLLNHAKEASCQCPKAVDPCEDEKGRFMIDWKWLPKISPEWKRRLSWIFIVSVLAESSFLVIQVIKTFQTKSADDLSLPAVIVLLVTNVIWMLMALFVLRDFGILISGIIYSVSSSVLIVGIVLYSGGGDGPGDGTAEKVTT